MSCLSCLLTIAVIMVFSTDGSSFSKHLVQLRMKKAYGGWSVLHEECPECSVEWSEARASSHQRITDLFVHLENLISQGDVTNAQEKLKFLKEECEKSVQVTEVKVKELRAEKSRLLMESESIVQDSLSDMQIVMREQAVAVSGVCASVQQQHEKQIEIVKQLLREQHAVELECQKEVLQAQHEKQLDMLQRQHKQHVEELNDLLKEYHIQLNQQRGHDSSVRLPADVTACNSKVEEARSSLLDIYVKLEEACERYEVEVESARMMLTSWLSVEGDVTARIETAISQIDDAGTVPTDNFIPLKDAYLAKKAYKREWQEEKQKLFCLLQEQISVHSKHDSYLLPRNHRFAGVSCHPNRLQAMHC